MYLEEEAIDYFRRYDILSEFLFHILSSKMGEIPSRRIGRNMEFEQYREYVEGDNLRDIDWKVYARSDRLYIKNYGSDVNFKLRMILDTSLSMNYPASSESKLEVGKRLVAIITHLLAKQKNRCYLSTINEFYDDYYEINLSNLEEVLQTVQPRGKTDIERIVPSANASEIVFFISDGWWKSEVWEKVVKTLVEKRIHFLQILSKEEMDLSISGNLLFTDMESGKNCSVIPSDIRVEYQKRLKERTEKIQKIFLQNELLYEIFPLDTKYYVRLKEFLESSRRFRR